MGGLTNELAVEPRDGASAAAISRELFGTPGIASVERATATTEFVRDRLDDFIGVLRITVGFALALALLIAFNSTTISADERARENATMLAFGVPVRGAVGLAVGESLLTGLLGTLLGLGGGLLVIGWVVNQTLPDTLPDLGLVVSIGAGSILVAALVGVIAVALAPLLTARRLRRMDVPSTCGWSSSGPRTNAFAAVGHTEVSGDRPRGHRAASPGRRDPRLADCRSPPPRARRGTPRQRALGADDRAGAGPADLVGGSQPGTRRRRGRRDRAGRDGRALALGEYLAGAVIALMLSGGNALEAAAGRRARRELTALLERAPRIAHRRREGRLEEVAGRRSVRVGDRVLVRAGEVMPVDGAVQSDEAVVDESTLTGEPLPVAPRRAARRSRAAPLNAGEAFDLRADPHRPPRAPTPASSRLVREAEHQRAPFVRMADRYAAHPPAGHAGRRRAAWALSGDPVRALAVLVVATPCPLILAAPVALDLGRLAGGAAGRDRQGRRRRSRSSGGPGPCSSTRPAP